MDILASQIYASIENKPEVCIEHLFLQLQYWYVHNQLRAPPDMRALQEMRQQHCRFPWDASHLIPALAAAGRGAPASSEEDQYQREYHCDCRQQWFFEEQILDFAPEKRDVAEMLWTYNVLSVTPSPVDAMIDILRLALRVDSGCWVQVQLTDASVRKLQEWQRLVVAVKSTRPLPSMRQLLANMYTQSINNVQVQERWRSWTW